MYIRNFEAQTYAIAKAVDTRCAIGQNIVRFYWQAGVVLVEPTAALARIRNGIAHARLVVLSFAKWQARPISALTFLQAFRSIGLWGRRRTF